VDHPLLDRRLQLAGDESHKTQTRQLGIVPTETSQASSGALCGLLRYTNDMKFPIHGGELISFVIVAIAAALIAMIVWLG